MIRQRALALASVLALVATIQTAPLSPQFSASVAARAQDTSAADAGEPTDLAIVALHCAEAPDTEALTSFFASATIPTRCAPAVGVAIAVTENGAPVPGSPFTTDVAGTLAVPVGLGSAVEVREDSKSLPAGYEALTREANGVPYANPVQLDPAVAGAAVLFVNVPNSVATALSQGTTAVDAGEVTDLAQAATPDRTGCDPAYPDERTCIAPGRPLAEPCSITDQRNFTVLPPDPRRLDADGDGIGCEPSAASGGTSIDSGSVNLYTGGGDLRGGDLRRAVPARMSDVADTDSAKPEPVIIAGVTRPGPEAVADENGIAHDREVAHAGAIGGYEPEAGTLTKSTAAPATAESSRTGLA